MTTYGIEPVVAEFTVRRSDGTIDPGTILPEAGRSCTATASTVTCQTSIERSSDPRFPISSTTIAGLPPGNYTVDVRPPAGYDVWSRMSVPSGGIAVIEPASRSRVVTILKPRNVNDYQVDLETCDSTNPTRIPCVPYSEAGVTAHMVPATMGRAPMSQDSGPQGASRANPGAPTITINGLAPGLYAPMFFDSTGVPLEGFFDADKTSEGNTELIANGVQPGQEGEDLQGAYVWIDPQMDGLGSHVPDDADAATRATFTIETCDVEEREALMREVGALLGLPIFPGGYDIPRSYGAPWGGIYLGQCSPAGPGSPTPKNNGGGGT